MTIIQLAQGQIGWYDPLTSIHLTLTNNKAIVKEGMNTTNIKQALSEGKIIIIQGTLETSREITEKPKAIFLKEEVKEEKPKEEIKKASTKTPKKRTPKAKKTKK